MINYEEKAKQAEEAFEIRLEDILTDKAARGTAYMALIQFLREAHADGLDAGAEIAEKRRKVRSGPGGCGMESQRESQSAAEESKKIRDLIRVAAQRVREGA